MTAPPSPPSPPSPLSAWRREYRAGELDERDVAADPLVQLTAWLSEAATQVDEPNAMVLATTDADGRPSARVVLLKGMDRRGLVFYTNLAGRKADELRVNPYAALVLYWEPLQRQVRISGVAAAVDEAEADAYFASRPRDSQLGAWASPQSRVVADRAELQRRFAAAAERFAGEPVPRPEGWGGFRVVPSEVEFWQGRPGRLHDRLRYRRDGDTWHLDRLAP